MRTAFTHGGPHGGPYEKLWSGRGDFEIVEFEGDGYFFNVGWNFPDEFGGLAGFGLIAAAAAEGVLEVLLFVAAAATSAAAR